MSLPRTYQLDDPQTFAYATARARWPNIIGQARADIAAHMAAEKHDSELVAQGERIVGAVDTLLHDLKHNSTLRVFSEQEVALIPSLQSYNDAFAEMESMPSWLAGPWLLIECYIYRLLDLFIKREPRWSQFDVFETLKRDTFKASAFGIYELAIRYKALSGEIKATLDAGKSIDTDKLKLLFEEFIDISLWGNATDLSLLANATLEDIQSRQGKEARAKSAKNILDNDLPQAWQRLLEVPYDQRRIDIVLDNAGFEFYTDLALTLFLLDSKLVKTVVFHCKTRPWMVSDTMVKDYDLFIQDMSNTEWFPEHRAEMSHFVDSIQKYHAAKQFQLMDSEYWTCAFDYWKMTPQETHYGGAQLYKYFQDSTLVIVKGDLNYRKLVGDREWPKTTSFKTGLGPLANSNIHILALRTCKADVCVGLQDGVEQQLIQTWKDLGHEIGELWCSSGKWAVVSYSDGQ